MNAGHWYETRQRRRLYEGSGYDFRMNVDDQQKFIELVTRLSPGGRLLAARDLEGGVSARTVAVEFERLGGECQKVVVRLHGEVDRAGNPNIAADEFRLLEIVHAAGTTAPRPLYLDTSCGLFDIPYLVVSFVEGVPGVELGDVHACARRMAEQLAALHRIDWSTYDLSFLPVQELAVVKRLQRRPEQLDEALSEGPIRAVLEAAWPPQSSNPPGLLHGDYWPGNLLWRDGEIVALIDWEDAATGDPLADVGNCRLELLWAFGEGAMTAFTERYRALRPSLDYTLLPLWDLYAALRPAGKLSGWGLDPATERRMQEQHRAFVEQAVGD